MHEGGGFDLLQPRQSAFRDHVAVVGTLRDDVEQHHRDAGIGHLGGDARAHRAGADDADFADGDAHQTRSRMVAMPWPPPMHWLASA